MESVIGIENLDKVTSEQPTGDMGLVSIIVPVYNTKGYLERCVNSLTGQFYRNVEIILVDDGSDDGSAELCDLLAQKDNRIKVYHRQNAGVSAARNYGIGASKGTYITFVDSDDWCHELFIRDLVGVIGVNEIAIGKIQVTDVLTSRDDVEELVITGSMNKKELIEDLLYQKSVQNGVLGKLYSRRVVLESRFPENIAIGEDFLFNYRIIKSHVDRAALSTAKYYYYFQRKGSAMSSLFSVRSMDAVVAVNSVTDDVTSSYPELNGAANRRLFTVLVRTLLTMQTSEVRDEYSVNFIYLSKQAKILAFNIIRDNKSSLADKLYAIAVWLSPVMLINIVKLKRTLSSRA